MGCRELETPRAAPSPRCSNPPPSHPLVPGREEGRIRSTYLCLSTARAGTLGDTTPSSAKCLCLTQGFGGRGGDLSRWGIPREGLGAHRAPHEVSEPAVRRPRAPGERQRGEGRIVATSPQRETAASAPSLLAAGASMCEGASEAAPGRRRQGRRRRFHRKPAWRAAASAPRSGLRSCAHYFYLPGAGLRALLVQTPRQHCLPPHSQGWRLSKELSPIFRGASTRGSIPQLLSSVPGLLPGCALHGHHPKKSCCLPRPRCASNPRPTWSRGGAGRGAAVREVAEKCKLWGSAACAGRPNEDLVSAGRRGERSRGGGREGELRGSGLK